MPHYKTQKFWLWLELDLPRTIEDQEDIDEAEFPPDEANQFDECGSMPPADTVCLDIIQFNSEFEINSVPFANVSVALGRRADDVTQVSGIHEIINSLKLQVPARVWLYGFPNRLSSDIDDCTLTWPDERLMIFEGYATGSGFRRTDHGAEFTLRLEHWLVDLNFSSSISRMSSPHNPNYLFYDATHHQTGNLGANVPNGIVSNIVAGHRPLTYFSSTDILNDFWGGARQVDVNDNHILGGLKDWLITLSKQERLNPTQLALAAGSPTIDRSAAINWEACRALRRFEPFASIPGPDAVDEDGYVLGVPLAMFPTGEIDSLVANAMAISIGQQTQEDYVHSTLWDKLAGQFHVDYCFSIVPLIRKALVVPFTPGLSSGNENDLIHRVLRTSEYEAIDLRTNLSRPLRGVGIFVNTGNQSGSGMNGDNGGAASGVYGGYFDKFVITGDERYREGLVMWKNGPTWLNGIVNMFGFTPSSTSVNGGTINTSVSPGAGNGYEVNAPDQTSVTSRSIWNKYAQALYIHEVLKERQGVIAGPVRFDIAPGSQLKVEMTEDKFVRRLLNPTQNGDCDDSWYTWAYCAVLRVSTFLDSQNNRAGTTFFVSHVRDESENLDAGTSTDRHPLWQRCRWGGCALIDNPAFAPTTTSICSNT